MQRLLLIVAGLVGGVGVAAAAAASHSTESRNLVAIAAICLSHGPALLALGLHGRSRALGVAAAMLAGGTALFVADLAMREWVDGGLFAGAAPIGGGAMVLGWMGVAVSGLLGKREN